MSRPAFNWRKVALLAATGYFTLQLILFQRALFLGGFFLNGSLASVGVAALVAVIYLAAIAFLAGMWRPKGRVIAFVFVALAIALTFRLYIPAMLDKRYMAEQQRLATEPKIAAHQSPALVAFLRKLDAAQEQYRLRTGRYASSIDSVDVLALQPDSSSVEITAQSDRAWSATASLNGVTCSIWSRDSALRIEKFQPEGSPTCGKPEKRDQNEMIPSIIVAHSNSTTRFTPSDLGGEWSQHRGDRYRTGVAQSSAEIGYHWDTRIGGPIRSSVSVGGNQVFVGAHGNGEVVALTLDSGKMGFRLRAPNWVHHEPALTEDLLLVGFGNNEWVSNAMIGTEPSGVAAYDRLTGLERWRQYTKGSVMSVPIIRGSLVATTTASGEPRAMRLQDGSPQWRVRASGMTPMGNPLLVDSLMIYGAEATSACAANLNNGRVVYCVSLANCKVMADTYASDSVKLTNCWGAGHASPAISGDFALQVFEMDFVRKPFGDRFINYLKPILGFRDRPKDPEIGEQILVGYQWRDGKILWRTSIGRGTTFPAGHIAGTPTTENGVAYIPAANNGNIVAVNVATGEVIWSSPVKASRGSVTLVRGLVLAGTLDGSLVALDQATGRTVCRQKLPAVPDRASITVAGETGILTLRDGLIMARPLSDWVACRA